MQNITLAIPYDLPPTERRKLAAIYQEMPGWLGLGEDGCPTWFGEDGTPRFLWASVEPSGLLISGELGDDEWKAWIERFMRRATEVLGFPVVDADE